MEQQAAAGSNKQYYFDGQTASSQTSNSSYNQSKMTNSHRVVGHQGPTTAIEALQSETHYQRMTDDYHNHSSASAYNNKNDQQHQQQIKTIDDDEDGEEQIQFKVEQDDNRNNKSMNYQHQRNASAGLELNNLSRQAAGHSQANRSQVEPSPLNSSRLTLRQSNSRLIASTINKGNAWRMLGVCVLVSAIIGGSSIGTVANFIPVETSFAKNSWRSGILVALFIIPTFLEYRYKRREVDYSSLITMSQYSFLLLTLLFQVLWTAGLIYASLNTIQSQAYVFNNVHGLYIVLISLFLGVVPSRKECIGVLLAILGCVCIILDPKANRVASGAAGGIEQSFWPAIIDLASAFFGALYFIMSARNVKNLPVCLLILLMNMHTFVINSCVAKYQNSEIEFFSFDVETGCFGFLNVFNQPLLPIASYALLASFFGSAGYVLCLLFYSPLVTSNAYLLEPFFAQMLGFTLGLDKLPGVMTAAGTLFAVGGIAFIDSGSRDRQSEDQRQLALQAQGGNSQNNLRGGEKGDGSLSPNQLQAQNLLDFSATLNQSGMMSLSGLNISNYSGR